MQKIYQLLFYLIKRTSILFVTSLFSYNTSLFINYPNQLCKVYRNSILI
jgi:hypothetical protein